MSGYGLGSFSASNNPRPSSGVALGFDIQNNLDRIKILEFFALGFGAV